MRLFILLAAFAGLLGGCTSAQQATVTETLSTPTLAPAPTETPPSPTEPPSTGEFESPCEPAHRRPGDDRQWGFLKWSPGGSFLVLNVNGGHDSGQAIWQVGAEGGYARLLANPRPYSDTWAPYGFHADLSPDGQRLVYSTCEYMKDPEAYPETELPRRVYELAVISVDGGEPERLTESAAADHYPVWHPNGSRIAYVGMKDDYNLHYRHTGAAVWVIFVDHDRRGPRIRRLHRIPNPAPRAPVWSPDGRYIAVVAAGDGTWGVYVADMGEGFASSPAVMVGETSISPSWSPDGTRLIFAKNHDGAGTSTVRIVNRDGTDAVELPETGGPISQVAWHPDGSEVLVAGTGGLWTISPDGQILRELFRPDDDGSGSGWGSSGITWSPDGSRFAVRDGASYVLATASREGDDWRILMLYSASGQGVLVCGVTTQALGYPSREDIEEHCEQSP